MREANFHAFLRAGCADPGIEQIERFKFSVDGASALRQLSHDDVQAICEAFRVVGGKGELDADRRQQFVKRLRIDASLRIDGDNFVFEYDEPQHFTKFRASTLESSLYERLRVGFDASHYASACGTKPMTGTSGFAHNDFAHRDFKCPTERGECRHRQRAFYDFLKDVFLGLRLDGIPRLMRIRDFEAGTSAEPRAAADLLRRRASWATRV